MDERDIEKILWFREDISPFLVHLTKETGVDNNAKTNLESILNTKELRYNNNNVSDARFGHDYESLTPNIEKDYFSAVCFTETPLNEIHSMLDIRGRNTNLQPYGLVFLKKKLQEKGVSPVIYINNFNTNKLGLVTALCHLITTNPVAAKQILPYISVFGKKFLPVKDTDQYEGIDFTWEREWRYSSANYCFKFENGDIFIGLCRHKEISYFEQQFPDLLFIDPRRNRKWYAEKLVEARQRADLKNSVV
jgi:hypothetical protein